jgi:phosphate starvation-inducible PhoH-like protein
MDISTETLLLSPEDNERLAKLCGQFDEHLKFIERQLHIQIHNRGFKFTLDGPAPQIKRAAQILFELYAETEKPAEITPVQIQLMLQDKIVPTEDKTDSKNQTEVRTPMRTIKARNQHQQDYVNAIRNNDVNFGVGPAGTGKTYLAVACAVEALNQDQVRRIVLVRPAVEAGERLGFLPGDITQKVDPYMRPLYDALFDTLGVEKVEKYIERGIIEIAPLAFMRGRTLNEAFIICDESQNTTKEQMKMFLTRIGFGAKAVICGDVTQVDLAKNITSGLSHCEKVLEKVSGIKFTYFTADDIVRHPLVQRIVSAYEKYD